MTIPSGTTTVFDCRNRPVRLGAILARGGEGEIFRLADHGDRLAKLYLRPSAEKQAKVLAMVGETVSSLTTISAWPIDTLHHFAGGPVVGFIMPFIKGHRSISALYSPKQRKQDFPEADWKFLVHAARNTAAAFATFHATGRIVIGDVNQRNILISDKAEARIIDCDSFQWSSLSKRFLCEVGVPEFTSPELQDKNFRTEIRSPNHDNFGLAILIFHMLFLGRHPFVGYHGPGDMPIEKAISEYRFVYGPRATGLKMSAPPYALPFGAVPAEIRALFEQAFVREGSRPLGRPVAARWFEALENLLAKQTTCRTQPGHAYFNGLSACPWCEIQARGGPDYFVSVLYRAQARQVFDISTFWASVLAVAEPLAGPPPVPGSYAIAGTPLPPGLAKTFLGPIFAIFGRVSPYELERRRRTQALRDAQRALDALQSTWQSELTRRNVQFVAKKQQLVELRSRLLGLQSELDREQEQLRANARQIQLDAFLDSNFIETEKLEGIGEGIKAILRSNGIETALDVQNLRPGRVQWVGQQRIATLQAWRARLIASFRFDPNRGLDQSVLGPIVARFNSQGAGIRLALTNGKKELEQIAIAAAKVRQDLEARFRGAHRALALTRADVAVL